MLPRPVQVSWGLEQRYEHFRIEPGDEASYIVGDYVIPAGQPFAGLRPNPGLASYAGTAPRTPVRSAATSTPPMSTSGPT